MEKNKLDIKRGERPQEFKTDEEWEKRKKARREDYYKHKQKRNAQTKIWRIEHKEEYKITKSISDKKYRLKNLDKLKEKNKEYRLKNSNILKEKRKEYYINNKDVLSRKAKERRLKNIDKIKEEKREYYKKNAKRLKEKTKKYRLSNPEKYIETHKKTLLNKKIQAMQILGGVICKKCGYNDNRALQFDHISGGGRLEKRTNNLTTTGIIRKIIRNPDEAIKKYQVLCANCNTIKITEKKEHPHILNPTEKQLKRRINQQKSQQKLKIDAMNCLGGVICNSCGSSDIRYLQVDHINGGGGKELEKISTSGVYKKIRDNSLCRKEYQVLCANCNIIKRIVNGEGKNKQGLNKKTVISKRTEVNKCVIFTLADWFN
jgi:hypothetical protein